MGRTSWLLLVIFIMKGRRVMGLHLRALGIKGVINTIMLIFKFSLWHKFRLTEKVQEEYKKILHALYPDSSNVNILSYFYLPIHTYFFLNPLRISADTMSLSLLILQCAYPKNKGTLLHNHRTIWIMLPVCSPYSHFTSGLSNVLLEKQRAGSWMTFICRDFFILNGPSAFLCFSWHWHFWRLQSSYLEKHLSICTCLFLQN